MANNIATPPPFFCRNRNKTLIIVANTWVARKAEPTSPRVAASQGEPMLGANIGWTRRGVPFWEEIGQMVRWHHPGEIRTYYQGWP